MMPLSDLATSRNAVFVAANYKALCEHVAIQIVALVRRKPDAVLGLATGSTPLGVYDALARRHHEDGLDFSAVTCFNLDEYYPTTPDSPHSYRRFMRTHLFDKINCCHWHVPDGQTRHPEEIARDCRRYEMAIQEAGGIDLQLLGIGRTGHIGFNEPGSLPDSRTRLVTLAAVTREDAAAEFGAIENVPKHAVSMGTGTILEARHIVLMACGAGKAQIVQAALDGEVTASVPASFIRRHHSVGFCFDTDAALFLNL